MGGKGDYVFIPHFVNTVSTKLMFIQQQLTLVARLVQGVPFPVFGLQTKKTPYPVSTSPTRVSYPVFQVVCLSVWKIHIVLGKPIERGAF